MVKDRLSFQLASDISTGENFSVRVQHKSLDIPPMVFCDGSGESCPHKSCFKTVRTCNIKLDSSQGGVYICGNAICQEYE